MLSKYIEMHYQEISSIGCNVLEFFFELLYTDYLSGLHKKFQESSRYKTHEKYKICIFLYNLFLSLFEDIYVHIHEGKPLKI